MTDSPDCHLAIASKIIFDQNDEERPPEIWSILAFSIGCLIPTPK